MKTTLSWNFKSKVLCRITSGVCQFQAQHKNPRWARLPFRRVSTPYLVIIGLILVISRLPKTPTHIYKVCLGFPFFRVRPGSQVLHISVPFPLQQQPYKNNKTMATDKSKPYFPLAGLANDGWSTEDEATATCYCGAVQLAFVSLSLNFAFLQINLSSFF